MNRLNAIAFVAALALGCTDGDKKSPATQAPETAAEAPAASAAPEAAGAAGAAATSSTPRPGQLLAAGQMAPPLDTVAHDGTAISMKALRGKPVVVYFYPRDATPG